MSFNSPINKSNSLKRFIKPRLSLDPKENLVFDCRSVITESTPMTTEQ